MSHVNYMDGNRYKKKSWYQNDVEKIIHQMLEMYVDDALK